MIPTSEMLQQNGLSFTLSNSTCTSGNVVVAGYILFKHPDLIHRNFYLRSLRRTLPASNHTVLWHRSTSMYARWTANGSSCHEMRGKPCGRIEWNPIWAHKWKTNYRAVHSTPSYTIDVTAGGTGWNFSRAYTIPWEYTADLSRSLPRLSMWTNYDSR